MRRVPEDAALAERDDAVDLLPEDRDEDDREEDVEREVAMATSTVAAVAARTAHPGRRQRTDRRCQLVSLRRNDAANLSRLHLNFPAMTTPHTPPPSAPRPSAADRRAELLHLAIVGIRAVGPDATMDEIAATCGITKPILYRHFGGRDGLIAAMAEHFADMVLKLVDAQLASGAVGKEVLRTTLRAYFHFIETDSNVYQFVNEYPASASHTSLVDQLATRIGADISRRRGGGSTPDPASLLWAHGIVGLAAQAGYWWVAQPAETRLRRDDAVELLLLGLDPEQALSIPIADQQG